VIVWLDILLINGESAVKSAEQMKFITVQLKPAHVLLASEKSMEPVKFAQQDQLPQTMEDQLAQPAVLIKFSSKEAVSASKDTLITQPMFAPHALHYQMDSLLMEFVQFAPAA
jgi:hypothetical protein